ncbi:MAG: serine hydrolase domain-containing protein [Promethearchaeota archaeon]
MSEPDNNNYNNNHEYGRNNITENDQDKKLIEDIDKYIVNLMEKNKIPGIALGIIKDGKILMRKGYGYADFKRKTPISTKSNFMIASITKTFTAIGIMQQWEKGIFKLDDDVNQYLPFDKVGYVGPIKNWKFFEKKRKKALKRGGRGLNEFLKDDKIKGLLHSSGVTFRRLLTHTAGIGEFKQYSDLIHVFKGFYFLQPARKPILPLEDRLKKGIPCYIPPGTKYSYANHGISLIGYLIEVFSGMPYHEYIQKNILDPLQMNNTDVIFSERVSKDFARGYRYSLGKYRRMHHLRSWGRPAGGIYSNVDDMIKYMNVLINYTKYRRQDGALARLLDAQTFKEMLKPHYFADERLSKIGLVFELYELNGKHFAWHGGYAYGYNSAMHISPEEQFGLIILSNCSKSRIIYSVAKEIIRRIFGVRKCLYPAPEFSNIEAIKREQEQMLRMVESPRVYKQFLGNYGRSRGWLTNTRFFLGAGEFKIDMISQKSNKKITQLILKSVWGSYKKGVILYPEQKIDENLKMPSDNSILFRFYEHLPLHTMAPYENIIFIKETSNEKEEGRPPERSLPQSSSISGLKFGFNYYPRKKGWDSLGVKVRLIKIMLMIVLLGIFFYLFELFIFKN